MKYGTIRVRSWDNPKDSYSLTFTSQDVFNEALGYILSNPKEFELLDEFFGYGSVESLAAVKDLIGHIEK